jgi:hypothetical protein
MGRALDGLHWYKSEKNGSATINDSTIKISRPHALCLM